jgi:uncharacterized protein (DUF433 family)
MDSLSVTNQRIFGTLERNQHIIQLLKLGVPQAEIARQFKVSRQRIFQIIKGSK